MYHVREAYNLMDLIGDLGGVLELMALLFSFIISPISEFSFFLKALEKLYLVKTKDNNFFPKAFKEAKKKNGRPKFKTFKRKIPDCLKNTDVEKNICDHLPIKLSWSQKVKMFFLKVFGNRCMISKKDKILYYLLAEG